jgi:hypothetical protein
LCTPDGRSRLAGSQIYTACARDRPPCPRSRKSVCLSEFVQLQEANDGCADTPNHCPRSRPRHTGRMRPDAGSVQTNCSAGSAVGEPSRARSRQGARHPTSSAACKPARLPAPKQASRSAIVRTFWTTAVALGHAGNTSTDHGSRRSQEWRRLASAQHLPGLGNRELTVCPSLACTWLPYSGAAKERAPTMPCHPCRWAGLAPNCARAHS